MVEINSTTRAVMLLDEWIAYAQELERDLERMRRKYNSAHERCEQLREIVAADYSALPF